MRAQAWHDASDGTLKQRRYYCQNWRADVVAILTEAGVQDERVWYSAYGVPFGMPAGDTDCDGDYDTNDQGAIALWDMLDIYDVRGDVNLDGEVTGADDTAATAESLGWEVLSGIDSRKGYAGYEHAPELAGTSYHVRYRVLKADLGRWLTRDPEGYTDGMSLYSYVQGMALPAVDPMGLSATCAASMPGQGRIAWMDEYGRRTSAPTKSRPAAPAPPPARYPSGMGPTTCFGGSCNQQGPGLPPYPMPYAAECQPLYPSDWDSWARPIKDAYCNNMANYWADKYGISRFHKCGEAFINAYVKECLRETTWEGSKKSDGNARSAGSLAFKKCAGGWAPGLTNPPKPWWPCFKDCLRGCMTGPLKFCGTGLARGAGCLKGCLKHPNPLPCFNDCWRISGKVFAPWAWGICAPARLTCYILCAGLCNVQGEFAS